MWAMAGRTAGPIKTKLGMGTHVDPGSVLVLTEARKGRDNRARSAINLRPEDGYLQLVAQYFHPTRSQLCAVSSLFAPC